MSISMINKVSEFHNRLVIAVAPFHGEELSQAQILKAYAEAFPNCKDNLKWVQGSDHSQNHTNLAPCTCSMTNMSIFERLSRGKYKVLV